MDVSTSGNYNQNELILHVQTTGASALTLKFYAREAGDESDQQDGVWISKNQASWIKVWDPPSSFDTWTAYTVDIGSEVNALNNPYSLNDFYIKFQQYDNYPFITDGIVWDEIGLFSDGTWVGN
tara:strand:+ start:96 stop:467 length:372 start_codon:yes stop_codon:yes gene_type:complete